MVEEGDEKAEKKRMMVESLGWLTESTIMPKKHRAIEGVGASSILELKAQLYKSQEGSKRDRLSRDPVYSASSSDQQLEIHRAKQKITANNPFAHRNSGVEARAAKDKVELKAVKDGSASYAALEKKAELYDKLVRGELSDEEDAEKYCVDFFRKGIIGQEVSQLPQGQDTCVLTLQSEEDNLILPNATKIGLGRASDTMDRSEHTRFVMEVHEEAKVAREKASDLKTRRQDQAAARREKLKQAYLRKQIEKLKASSNIDQT